MTQSGSLTRWATWREIHAQPDIWRKWGVACPVADLRNWVADQKVTEVWFCGAGTSAYIGDILVAGLEGAGCAQHLRSVPSTDLVARPAAYLSGRRPLIVSFGRSGNSTESIGTLDALDALAPKAPRLHVTCNAEGALATRSSEGPIKVVVLPSDTHDTGFAMTSSFSTMLLTALAIIGPMVDFAQRMSTLADALDQVLAATPQPPLSGRAVYVGSGPLCYAAREAALKVMELSAGLTPALWDSILGFRHGPKSFVVSDTYINIFMSDELPDAHYAADLAEELVAQFPQATVQTIGPGADVDIPTPYGPLWSAPLYVATAQLAAVRRSEALGLNVDNPFSGQGTLTRVVSGVRLYPVAS